jgi:hypothetical protein
MGRHSAPDQETGPDAAVPGAGAEPAAAPVTTPETAPGAASEAAPVPADPAGTHGGRPVGQDLPPGSRGDLQLLRTRPRLRAACAGAVVVCFAIFTVVLIVLGRSDVYLIWLWIPIVVSGVAIGALLDRAHRSLDRPR